MGAKIKPQWAKENLSNSKSMPLFFHLQQSLLNFLAAAHEAFEKFINSDFHFSSELVLPERVGTWHKRVIDGPIILQGLIHFAFFEGRKNITDFICSGIV